MVGGISHTQAFPRRVPFAQPYSLSGISIHSVIIPLVTLLGFQLALATSAAAQTAVSRFDVPAVLPFATCGCEASVSEEITAIERQMPLPGEKWIELRIPLTHWLPGETRAEVHEVEYRIVEMSGRARVVDFTPQAQIASDLAGNIAVERKQESNRNTSVTIGGITNGAVNINGQLSGNQAQVETERYERIAPTRQVIASGTTEQGRGIVIRFRSAPGLPLEGALEVGLRLAVPLDCDAVLLRVVGQSTGTRSRSSNPHSNLEVLGREQLWIAAFESQSLAARRRAESFANSYFQLRDLARQHPVAPRSRSPIAQVRKLFSDNEPQVPANWLEQLLASGSTATLASFESGLAAPVQQSAEVYLAQRAALLQPTELSVAAIPSPQTPTASQPASTFVQRTKASSSEVGIRQ